MKTENPIISFFKTQYSKKNIRVLQPIRLFFIRAYVYRKKFIWSFDEDERRLLLHIQRTKYHIIDIKWAYAEQTAVLMHINNYLLETASEEQKVYAQKVWDMYYKKDFQKRSEKSDDLILYFKDH